MTGGFGVNAMALLDEANAPQHGTPEISSVSIGVRNNSGTLISGHDLTIYAVISNLILSYLHM